MTGQTPGLIIKPATGGGAAILDPDGDGYVSQKTDGNQVGFTIPPNNDVLQSEIPYVALVRPDIQGDLERGPTGGFTEIVGTDEIGNNAILTYTDGVNLYYRFRLSGYAPNSKSYSILIDTDGKFGSTGANPDPDAQTGNPGFEVEIVLETNFDVKAYNVSNSPATPAILLVSASYDTNCQKSVAVSTAGGDPDYFYDFYLPYASLSFTNNTALRYVALTSMNPMPAIGNNAVSDVGGVGDIGSLDQAFIDLITPQTPTLPGQEVLERTTCPLINTVGVGDASISGTTVSGATVNVYVYQSNGTTLLGSGTATTTGTTWSINVSSIKNASNIVVPLVAGYKIKATALAPGYAVSLDNCDIESVNDCSVVTSIPLEANFVKIGGNKGFDVSPARPSGTKVYLYTSNYSLLTGTFKNGITNPYTTTTNNQTFSFEFQGGQSFPDGVYYFQYEEPGKCISPYFTSCLYATGTVSAIPTITTTSITTSSTQILGTGTAASSVISIYADGNLLTTTTSAATAPFGWTATVSNLSKCQVITARQVTGTTSCMSDPTAGITVTAQAAAPSILNPGCFISPGTIYGTSSEIGATVTLYRTSSSTGGSIGSLGTAIVQSNGTWSVGNLTLGHGDILDAAVTSGTCLTASVKSAFITISTPPNISAYPITFNTVTEGGNSLSGTIFGVTSAITLKLFVDGTLVGSTTVTSSGNWSITGINSLELYAGGKVQATVTIGSGCESALSSSFTTIQCLAPVMPDYIGGSKSYCLGGTGQVALTTSQTGVIYQLVNASGVAVGPAASGTGGTITLFTNALNADLLNVYVKAYKIGTNACAITSSTAINFDTESLSPSVTFSSTSLSVARGTTTVSLAYTTKSTNPSADFYTIDYTLAANNQGFTDITTQTAIPVSPINLVVPAAAAIGTYSGTITIYSSANGSCPKSYSFTITVFQSGSAPVISTHPVNQTICSGTAAAALTVTASGTATLAYQWQSSTSFSFTLPTNVGTNSTSYSPGTLTSTMYYRVIVSNSNGSVTSNVATITAIPTVGGTGTISGTSTVCAGQNSVNYSVLGITNATNYTWNYTGTGALINGTGTSVFINFSNSATSGILTVTGTGINNCGSVTSSNYSISVNPLPIVSAGVGITTCSSSGAVNITSGASASIGSTVNWTSSGTGSFANAGSLTDATYTPSADDKSAGSVTLTLTATNSCGNSISTKTLTIIQSNTITLSSAALTNAQSVCINNAITNITYTTTSATGATFSGLPAGVTGAWASNVVTISGTPTESSATPYTYTITLTGGCGTVTATGTIRVNPINTITLTSAVGTNAQSVCINNAITNITYTTTSATGATFSGLPAGVTGAWASNVVTISGTPTVSSVTPYTYTVTLTGGCGTITTTGNITVHANPNPSDITIH